MYFLSTECQIEIVDDEINATNPTVATRTCYIGANNATAARTVTKEIEYLIHKARGEHIGNDMESIKVRRGIRQARTRYETKIGPKLPPCPDLTVSSGADSAGKWEKFLQWEKDCVNLLRANNVPCRQGFLTQPQVPGDRDTEVDGYHCSNCDEVFKKPGQCLQHMHRMNHKSGLKTMKRCVKNWTSAKARQRNQDLEHERKLKKIFDSEDPDEIRAACAKMDKEMGFDKEMIDGGNDDDDDGGNDDDDDDEDEDEDDDEEEVVDRDGDEWNKYCYDSDEYQRDDLD